MAGLLAVATVVGVGHVVARYAKWTRLAAVAKPLPILLLALWLAATPAPPDSGYRWLVVAGLVCSMAGDVWLLFPAHFRRGLASFLVAHLCYIAAFARAGTSGGGTWAVLLPFAVAGAGMLAYLWPHLGRERAAVALYVTVLVVMAWRAAARVPVVDPPGGALAVAGASAFLVSDGTLSVDRFARRFHGADAVVMVTYYVAQSLIAASALG